MKQVAPKAVELNVKGMTCTNCALGIERYLKQEGLQGVSVDFSNEEVNFELLEPRQLPKIIKGIEQLGYEVVMDEEESKSGWSKIEKYFYFSLIFTLPLLLHMFVKWAPLHNPWVQLALAAPVYLLGMYHFGRSAWRSMKSGVPNMDVLITIGASAAFFYSLYGTLLHKGPDFLFYETAASIISLVLLGNLLEHKAVQKTTTAVQELSRLQRHQALRLKVVDGKETFEPIDARQLKPGDVVRVNTGDRIPADGEVMQGEAEVDESMISGESAPVHKQPGSPLIGGTLLVSGHIRARVKQVGKDTVLAQIIELVKKAQADKPAIQQLADRISAVFVPVVLGIALLTFVLSHFVFHIGLEAALIHSVAVLVIACPCAMGLATPTAVVVGIGRASRKGILIKGGRTLEQFSRLGRIVFDKTGTLTTGQFRIQQIESEPAEEPLVRRIVYSLELHSSHPLAHSLLQELQADGVAPIPLKQVKEHKGMGLEGVDEAGNHYRLGSARFTGQEASPEAASLYLLRNGARMAAIWLEDEIRPGAKESIDYLKEQGMKVALLSGDRREKCESVARALGIDEVYAERLPQEKLALIEQMSREMPTAMVGDGINDAPALARASLGISLSQATQVAVQSAQVILLSGRLSALKDLFQIGKHTVLTIKQNLFWAFFYNVVAIPFAALGFLSPIIAAAAMAMSDVVVIGNSLRLKVKRL